MGTRRGRVRGRRKQRMRKRGVNSRGGVCVQFKCVFQETFSDVLQSLCCKFIGGDALCGQLYPPHGTVAPRNHRTRRQE